MHSAAIIAPFRTAVGTFGGCLRDVPVEALGKAVINRVLRETEIDPAIIGDVVFAQSYANSETPCVGRWLALEAGLPVETPGMQLDRRCGGGLQAIATAAMMVQAGVCDAVIAGGIESMSNIEFYSTTSRWGQRMGNFQMYDRLERGRERSQPEWRFGHISGMIETAENLASLYGITREDADVYSLQSHQRAAAAQEAGLFAEEIEPIAVPQRRGEAINVQADEGIREDASLEKLMRLKPIIDGGTVTAGNAAQQSDAAAACLVVREDKLAAYGLSPSAFLVGWAAAGCDPATMGIGPVPATERLLARTGLSLDDMDLIEVNEAFACQVLSVMKAWTLEDRERVNVNGSGISLGHPIGATGVRIATTLIREMQRRSVRYGLETMCVGGGQGIAALFERA